VQSDWSVFALVSLFFFATTVRCVRIWRGGNGSIPWWRNSAIGGTVHQLGKTVLAGPVVFGAMALLLLTHQLLRLWHGTFIQAILYTLYGIWWFLIAIGVLGSYYVNRNGRPRFLIPPQYRDR
jgi:hypothetical protein